MIFFRYVMIHCFFAGNEGNEGKDEYTEHTSTTVNSVSCSSNADATAFSAAKSAHVNAFAEAHKHACSKTSDPKWNGSIVSDWQKGAAFAVAKVSSTSKKPAFCCLHACVQFLVISSVSLP
jgi:hypothetical protein